MMHAPDTTDRRQQPRAQFPSSMSDMRLVYIQLHLMRQAHLVLPILFPERNPRMPDRRLEVDLPLPQPST